LTEIYGRNASLGTFREGCRAEQRELFKKIAEIIEILCASPGSNKAILGRYRSGTTFFSDDVNIFVRGASAALLLDSSAQVEPFESGETMIIKQFQGKVLVTICAFPILNELPMYKFKHLRQDQKARAFATYLYIRHGCRRSEPKDANIFRSAPRSFMFG
jgi:hypothetical protein